MTLEHDQTVEVHYQFEFLSIVTSTLLLPVWVMHPLTLKEKKKNENGDNNLFIINDDFYILFLYFLL